MRSLIALVAVLMVGCIAAATLAQQERIEIGPIEFVNPGAPEDLGAPMEPAAEALPWHQSLPAQARLGIIAVAIGVPMGIIVIGRFWRSLPEVDRIAILLCAAIGRGRGFRKRVASLSRASGPGGRPITPVAMLLAPRAFDEALTNATHAERAYGVPLRHAVHGFRKN